MPSGGLQIISIPIKLTYLVLVRKVSKSVVCGLPLESLVRGPLSSITGMIPSVSPKHPELW